MFRFYYDLSLRAKAFAASIVLLFCLLALGVNSYFTLNKAADGLQTLSQVNLPKQQVTLNLKNDIVATHMNIFRYVSWASNGVNEKLLRALHSEVLTSLTAMRNRLTRLTDLLQANSDTHFQHAEMSARWQAYERTARDTLDVGSSDAPMATMMLGMTDDAFQSIIASLENIAANATEETRTITEQLSKEADSNKAFIAIGGILGVLVSLIVTLFVARSIVGPIQSVTAVMTDISAGHLNVEIGYRDRGDEIGQMVRAIDIFRKNIERDNKALNDREQELRAQNMRFDAALKNMSQGLVMFDGAGKLVVSNDRYAAVYGLASDALKPGMTFRQLLECRIAAGTHDGTDIDEFFRRWTEVDKSKEQVEAIFELHNGRFVALSRRALADGGFVSTHEDVTERQRAETKIRYMARHDALTGLANRFHLLEEVENSLARVSRYDEKFAIFFLDLDLFKTINDSLGHPIGDALLREVAKRLRDCTGASDTVARIGGDEFAILHKSAPDQKDDAITLANRILASVVMPYQLDGHQVNIETSIGIALAPCDGMEANHLLKNADLALYKAKSSGRNGYRFFESEMEEEAQSRRTLEVRLRKAIAEKQFELHYQPVIDSVTLDNACLEALVRWRHPEHGLIAPNKFIPLAEETGLIVPLGDEVLRQACADAVKWPSQAKVAVNLSAVQFRKGNVLDSINRALAQSGLPPKRLEVEITETVLLDRSEANLAILHQLRKLGVSIALDDFGTGYSSLSYLRLFPFDKIKIDKSFVAEMSNSGECAAIVSAITYLGRSLNVITTAEGVETQQQFELLRAAGCTQMQGFLLGRPCPISEFDFSRAVDVKLGGQAA